VRDGTEVRILDGAGLTVQVEQIIDSNSTGLNLSPNHIQGESSSHLQHWTQAVLPKFGEQENMTHQVLGVAALILGTWAVGGLFIYGFLRL
jgi:hypothetical protein